MLTIWHGCFSLTGSGNHRYFMGYLFFLLCMICWMMYGCICCKYRSSFLFARLSLPLWFPFLLPCPDWRIHCSTSYAKDGFWLYLTQIASCSPWMLWMFLNSVFHFMWVAVLIMCQLYQVWSPKNICNRTISFPIPKVNPLSIRLDRSFGNHHEWKDECPEIQAL